MTKYLHTPHISHISPLLVFAFSFLSLGGILFPDIVSAQTNYVPLTGIPGVDPNENLTLVSYLNALYILTITIGALFGVIKIAYAGVKYAMSDIVTDKEKAKKDIIGVLLGLGILLATYVVLYTINPDLTKLNILENAQSPQTQTLPSQTVSTGGNNTQVLGTKWTQGSNNTQTAQEFEDLCSQQGGTPESKGLFSFTVECTRPQSSVQTLQEFIDQCNGDVITHSDGSMECLVTQPSA